MIVRPLFSASFGVSLFFVALVSTAGPLARLVAAPMTGFLADRVGRRPLAMAGLATRSLFSFISFFAASYPQFLLFEFVGSVGLSVWTTAGTIVVADVSSRINRGRAVALRTSSQRLGNMIGPIIAGILGQAFGLRSIFFINAAGKFGAFLIFLFMIRESRPDSAAAESSRRPSIFPRPSQLREFVNRPVLVVLFATMAIHLLSSAGAFEVLFPIHATRHAGFTTLEVGQMVSLLALATFLVSIPNGLLMDRWGRKTSLLPGMAILAVSSYLLSGGTTYWTILVAIVILGVGEGMGFGATQVIAMDLAPEEQRGSFLGVWTFLTSVTGIAVPIAIGSYGQFAGTINTFIGISAVLMIAVPVVGIFGPETRAPRESVPEGATPA